MADKTDSSGARLLGLHADIIRGERAALERLASELWLPLRRRLRRSFPLATADIVADSSNDAILTYMSRPSIFDPDRHIPLDHFLYGIAARILRDRLRSNRRRRLRETDYAQHLLRSRRRLIEDGGMGRAAVREIRNALERVCNATEFTAMSAWLDEDDTGLVAVRLGVSHLRPEERRREVKRFIERVIKRLRRLLR